MQTTLSKRFFTLGVAETLSKHGRDGKPTPGEGGGGGGGLADFGLKGVANAMQDAELASTAGENQFRQRKFGGPVAGRKTAEKIGGLVQGALDDASKVVSRVDEVRLSNEGSAALQRWLTAKVAASTTARHLREGGEGVQLSALGRMKNESRDASAALATFLQRAKQDGALKA